MPNHDQQAHFAVALGLYYTFVHMYLAEWISSIIVIVLDVVWQIKDGLVPIDGGKEVWKYLGGDGFSYRNLVYDMSGLALALIIDLAVPPHIRGTITPSEAEAEQSGSYSSGSGGSGSGGSGGSSGGGSSGPNSFNTMHLNAHNAYRADH